MRKVGVMAKEVERGNKVRGVQSRKESGVYEGEGRSG